jgi:hypothetical protein
MTSIEYTSDFELILKAEGERAEAMGILHLNASNYFNFFYVIINLPIIALSSIIGLLSAIELFKYQNIVYASIFILLGILKAIDSFFSFAKRSETHRIISLQYNKIHKIISIQLSINKSKRYNANHLFKLITSEIQNINESEPIIPNSVLNNFKTKYQKYETAKPNIVNGLTSITIHKENGSAIMIPNIKIVESQDSEPYSDA